MITVLMAMLAVMSTSTIGVGNGMIIIRIATKMRMAIAMSPRRETARSVRVSVSVVGIGLHSAGEKIAERSACFDTASAGPKRAAHEEVEGGIVVAVHLSEALDHRDGTVRSTIGQKGVGKRAPDASIIGRS